MMEKTCVWCDLVFNKHNLQMGSVFYAYDPEYVEWLKADVNFDNQTEDPVACEECLDEHDWDIPPGFAEAEEDGGFNFDG